MSRVTWEQPSDEHGDDPECVHVWDYTYNEAGECFECGMLLDDLVAFGTAAFIVKDGRVSRVAPREYLKGGDDEQQADS